MKKFFVIMAAGLMSVSAFAVERVVYTSNLGLRLSDEATQTLRGYAATHGRRVRLEPDSVQVEAILSEDKEAKSFFVNFTLRNTEIRDREADGARLFCEASIVPVRADDEAQPTWKVEGSGCEI